MKMLTMNKKAVLIGLCALLFAGLFLIASCAPSQSPTDATATEKKESTAVSMDGEYVSDEQCLSCHGNSYEALAETTASYGDWNPHDSIHGGPNSCVNCHERDREITDNQCEHCHQFTPEGLVR